MSVFYDRAGRPVAYSADSGDLYLYSGEPVGYLEDDSVYSFSGNHLGWYVEGWIRNHLGEPVFFTREAAGFPKRPAPLDEPQRDGRRGAPSRAPKESKPQAPERRLQWSLLSSERFFSEVLQEPADAVSDLQAGGYWGRPGPQAS
ncbi:MAG: hypothetical protein HY534_04900 [Chloroflexi bacterium]|nr:hypothetical protein [Chloroflexota bacterium]